MTLELYEKPKNVTIIEGFPGYGLVGSITTEFLVDHLDAKLIGKIFLPKQPAIATIHQSRIIYPMSIFYSKARNTIVLEGLYVVPGSEWDIANDVIELAKLTKAKEIISLEGVHVPSQNALNQILKDKIAGEVPDESQESKKKTVPVFYFTKNTETEKTLKEKGYKPIKEGVVMGVSGSLLLKSSEIPHCCLFAEAKTEYPDSEAAAELIKALDSIVGLEIDYKPLLKSAEQFERKLKELIQNTIKARENTEKRDMNYVG